MSQRFLFPHNAEFAKQIAVSARGNTDMKVERRHGLFPGCTLAAQRIGFKHLGIYAGNGRVVHSSPRVGEVALESIVQFADGGRLSRHHIQGKNPRQTLLRALGKLGTPFDLLLDNCEHFVRSMNGLPKHSYQLQKACAVASGMFSLQLSAIRKQRFAGAGVAVAAALTPEHVPPLLAALLGVSGGLILEHATR